VCLTGLTGVEPLSKSCSVSLAGAGLTGGAHRSDRCWLVDLRFGVLLRSQVGRVCVLVSRSSGTPVATWAWPTWVVSRRRVLEAVFILFEFPSPPRRFFYRLPFTPHLSGSPYRSFSQTCSPSVTWVPKPHLYEQGCPTMRSGRKHWLMMRGW
jgi:hypothetical protein